jgi:hypothetical protein
MEINYMRILLFLVILTGCVEYDCTGKTEAYERQVEKCMEARVGKETEGYEYCSRAAMRICKISDIR